MLQTLIIFSTKELAGKTNEGREEKDGSFPFQRCSTDYVPGQDLFLHILSTEFESQGFSVPKE